MQNTSQFNNNDTEVDKEEYQTVFRVFDKKGEGKITIQQVNEFINRFDQVKIVPEGTQETNKNDFMNSSKQITKTTNGYAQATMSQNNRINAKASPNKRLGSNNDNSQYGKKGAASQYLKQGSLSIANNKNDDNNEDSKNNTNNSTQSPHNSASTDKNQLIEPVFPNGKTTLQFEEFFNVVNDSVKDPESAENYLVYAFSMFDREKKGFINSEDLKVVFNLLGENVTDEEVNTMIKIAGVKSHDKINFKEFVDFFNKKD